jgi:hypothetical protein
VLGVRLRRRPPAAADPTREVRTVEWIGRHSIPEVRHHTRDVAGIVG